MLIELMPKPIYSLAGGCDHLPHLMQLMDGLATFHALWWEAPKKPPSGPTKSTAPSTNGEKPSVVCMPSRMKGIVEPVQPIATNVQTPATSHCTAWMRDSFSSAMDAPSDAGVSVELCASSISDEARAEVCCRGYCDATLAHEAISRA